MKVGSITQIIRERPFNQIGQKPSQIRERPFNQIGIFPSKNVKICQKYHFLKYNPLLQNMVNDLWLFLTLKHICRCYVFLAAYVLCKNPVSLPKTLKKYIFFYQKVVQFSNKKILQNTCQNQQKFVKISTNNVKIGQHRVKISKIGQHRVNDF